MTPTTLTCQHCAGASFAVVLMPGNDADDTHTYIQLSCQTCRKATPTMHFVVDLTPEFNREEASHA